MLQCWLTKKENLGGHESTRGEELMGFQGDPY